MCPMTREVVVIIHSINFARAFLEEPTVREQMRDVPWLQTGWRHVRTEITCSLIHRRFIRTALKLRDTLAQYRDRRYRNFTCRTAIDS